MQLLLGIFALILNLLGYIPYVRDIICRKVKPHRITWSVWTILTIIAAYNQVQNGGGYSALFFISTAGLVTFVFLLSLKYGMGGAAKIDRICLVLALLLLAYWITLQETYFSTIIAVIIDGLGAIPTLIKTYHYPKTESYPQWSLAGVAGILTLFSVPRFDWILVIYPVYVILMNGLIIGVKFWRETLRFKF